MARHPVPSQSVAPSEVLLDTIMSIVEPHFDRFTVGFIDRLIWSWSEDEGGSEVPGGLKHAIEYIYRVANYDRDRFKILLDRNFPERKLSVNPSSRETKQGLDACSRHCSGDITSEDPMWVQCRRLSSLPDDVLKSQIGEYFRMRTNSHIKEKYSALYDQIRRSEGETATLRLPGF